LREELRTVPGRIDTWGRSATGAIFAQSEERGVAQLQSPV
jgi:hypothetical protein